MPICVSVEHGDVISHDSMIGALLDYIECSNEPGVSMWWESDLEREFAEIHVEMTKLSAKNHLTHKERARYSALFTRSEKIKKENQ